MVYDSVFNVLLCWLFIDSLYILTHFQFFVNNFLLFFVIKLSFSDNSYMISYIFSVVNNFFYFLSFGFNNNLHYQVTIIFPLINSRSQRQLVYNNT